MPENAGSTYQMASQGTSGFTAPSIGLPKGGGAIRGIDEKFAANPSTGAGSLSVPIPLTPSRSGFGPQLNLSYDSGAGNGPFGFGWSLSLPSIVRRTDKGLPRYADCGVPETEADIFILSGAEDLVPVLVRAENGDWIEEPISPRDGYSIKSYRPRTEGLFSRIERWTRQDDGATHWRSISKDNVMTVYGRDDNSRIADPCHPNHVFRWLICASYDDQGNAIVYDYAAENAEGVDLDLASERNRIRSANRYIRRIRYGNRVPARRGHPVEDGAQWMFSAIFDYGEGRYTEEEADSEGRIFARATIGAQHPWAIRRDPFSSFRSCFEVRTYRLCRRVMMVHHFAEELGAEDCLVRSTAFEYLEKPIGAFLSQVKQSGHLLQENGRYLTRSLPPLDLGYTPTPLEAPDFDGFELREVDEESLRDLPAGIDGENYRWLDLDGEGIAGVLSEQDQSWFYKENLGGGKLGATLAVHVRPAMATLGGAHRFMDVAGDGSLDLVDFSRPSPGYYERNNEGGWEGFRAFHALPVVNWNDPNVRFADVTGDGIADVLITEDDAFKYHPSLLTEGYGEAVRVHIPLEEEQTGPRAVFADGTQSIYLADMTGDGMPDIVRIRNGEISYWSNLGYGRFGAKVTMDRAPWFDTADLFDQRRIRLADTDGSGTSDIIYLGHNRVEVFLNEMGNGWSSARVVHPFPSVDNLAAMDVMDLLGRGTSCLVWSSPLPGDSGRQLRYLDLMCGRKPHLLDRVVNHAGAETRIDYASSTEFYLADRAAGTPWVTRLPFPVHVVKRMETYDEVSRDRFVSRYSYHHGFYDGLEREFRGFGRMDQIDSEEVDDAFSVPPVLTKTWTHTGFFLASGRISRRMEDEYFPGGAPLPDTILPEGLTPFEAREACRSLKGAMLRQEIYGLDGTANAHIPYAVSESNFTIRPVQPVASNRYAVFFTHPRETIALHYERDPDDPRIGHALTLAVDEYGNTLKSASIGYQRRKPGFDEQAKTLATIAENRYTNAILEPDDYRTPRGSQASSYELTAPQLTGFRPLDFDSVVALVESAREIPYDARPSAGEIEKRLIERSRSIYRKNDLDGFLPLGRVESKALPGESYKLALTRGLLDIFAAKANADEMRSILAQAQYRDLNGDGPFWIPSGRIYYSPHADDSPARELDFARAHFFLPHRFRDPFANTTLVAYDVHNLAVVSTRDAVGNETAAEFDYRVVQAKRVTDPNGNRAEARFDALGMVAGTAVMGKATGPAEGDSLHRFAPDLTRREVREFFDADNPYLLAERHLGTATTRIIYDLDRVPVCAASIARETHVSDLAPGQQTRVQMHFVYTDGFGRVAQTRTQAEPGPLDLNDPASPVANPRWVGSGAKIYNNRGKPVRQYEPFFSPTPKFGIEKWGVSNTLFYDPISRVIATLHPDNTFEKVVFDAWKQATYDVNDTVTLDPAADPAVGAYFRRLPVSDYLPTWYQQRIGGALGPHEREAAVKAAKDAETPSVSHFDALGRTFLSIADNGCGQFLPVRTVLDIKGNARETIDPLDRVVARYDYDMLNTKLRQASMESGERWMLNAVDSKPARAWNSRGFAFRMEYDPLRRPLRSFVGGGSLPREILFERKTYGESPETGLSEAQRRQANVRGKIFRDFDGAGVVVTDLYDFKGNSLRDTRRFTCEYKHPPDWLETPALEARVFSSASVYDALNRVIAATAPDGSVYRPKFNDASLLEAVDVNLRGAAPNGQPVWTPFIDAVNYDAKGQRTICRYANGSATAYTYDAKTFRLIRLKTTRAADEKGFSARIFKHGSTIQDLHYTYDPAGNVVRIEDAALKTVFHSNQQVDAACEYSYDPIYRLIEATGREHIGQSAFRFHPEHGDDRDYPFEGAAQLQDPQALQGYIERYEYDPAGNFLKMQHRAAHRNWTREYRYSEASLLDRARHSNRLSETTLAGRDHPDTTVERYTYDAHGNMTRMPHLPSMEWNYQDQLSASSRQVVRSGEPETTYYVYDGSGQRTRKVTEGRNGSRASERFYVGGFEVFREYSGGGVSMERETLHVMDDRQRVALVETRTVGDGHAIHAPAPELRYQLANHLGSATLEIDEAGGLITYEEYSPYGDSTFQAGLNASEVRRKRYRYTGKERDEENGFTYHGARYYAPWLGRWTASDPGGLIDGTNTYAFVRNNPVQYTDAKGADCDPSNSCCVDPTLSSEDAGSESSSDSSGTCSADSDDSSSAATSSTSDAVAAGGLLTAASAVQAAAPSGAAALVPAQTSNSIEDLLTFARAQAGFETGAVRPPTFNWRSASPFGTAAHAEATDVIDEMKNLGFYDADRILSEVRVVNGVVTQIGGTPGGPRGAHNLDVVVERPGSPIAVGDDITGGVAESIGDFKYGGGVINPAYGVYGSPLSTINGATAAGPLPDLSMTMSSSARLLAGGAGVLNAGGGVFMLASVDVHNDPGLLTAGKITSGTASVVGGGLEIGGAAFGAAEAVGIGAGLSTVGAVVAAPIIAYELGKPRGVIAYDPQLADRAIREGRNPFCAQCHGPGGALDPNNDWNSQDPARRAAYLNRLQWVDLGR